MDEANKRKASEAEEKKDEQDPSKKAKTLSVTKIVDIELDVQSRCMQCQKDRYDVLQFGPTCPHVMCIACAMDYTNYQMLYCNYRTVPNPENWILSVAKGQWQASIDEKKFDIRGKRDCPICKRGHLSLSSLNWTVYPNWVYQYLVEYIRRQETHAYTPLVEPALIYASGWDQISQEMKEKIVKQYNETENARKLQWESTKNHKEEKKNNDRHTCIWGCGTSNKDMAPMLCHMWNCSEQTFQCPLPTCGMRIKIGPDTPQTHRRLERMNQAWTKHITENCKYRTVCTMCKTLKSIPICKWKEHREQHIAFRTMQAALIRFEQCLISIHRRPGFMLEKFTEGKMVDTIKELETMTQRLTSQGIAPFEVGSVVAAKYDGTYWSEARVMEKINNQRIRVQFVEDDVISWYDMVDMYIAYWKVQEPFVGQTVWPKNRLNPGNENWTVDSLDLKTPGVANETDRIAFLAQYTNPKNACIIGNEAGTKKLFVLSEHYRMIPNANLELWHGAERRVLSDSDEEEVVVENAGVAHMYD